ncbi:hypothetical protein P0082_00260 [Candidatus Haliotispira prima]|uniref:Acylneuraminate cytidylyltransferase n=1 Tax=Candidatus Haliotispira prima TaxID=3034016 RepID=A0ABY8MJD8_9SPIO|nr:hypothetical protein P0082_00260 [Candidatus Haliotispira prima]
MVAPFAPVASVASRVDYQVMLQVRLGSRRLPRKALLPLGGAVSEADLAFRPCVLDWVLYHLRQSRRVQRFVLLCPYGDVSTLAPYAERHGFELFGGPEQDVLERFCCALQSYPARYCFRATGDNPLAHGSLSDFMVAQLERRFRDAPDLYRIEGLPYGFAVELFRSAALLRLRQPEPGWMLESEDREHVTRFLYRRPQDFALRHDSLSELLGPDFAGLASLRLTLDTAQDYQFLQQLFVRSQQRGILPSAPNWGTAEPSVSAGGPGFACFPDLLPALRDIAISLGKIPESPE